MESAKSSSRPSSRRGSWQCAVCGLLLAYASGWPGGAQAQMPVQLPPDQMQGGPPPQNGQMPQNGQPPRNDQAPPFGQRPGMMPGGSRGVQLNPLAGSRPALPASAPTVAAPAAAQMPAAPAAASGVVERPKGTAQRARVQVVGRTLEIRADDASLNQILRDIARETGMKITGGVADERVYGVYGPADISAVLTRLLDGMGTNMLLVENQSARPVELILTPQHGGATPPSPFAGARAEEENSAELPPQLQPHVQRLAPVPGQASQPESVPAASGGSPAAATTPVAAEPATTTVQSPNGVKTPQEIYEQLMKMQQGTNKPGTTTTPQ